jgi:hypothetical protein
MENLIPKTKEAGCDIPGFFFSLDVPVIVLQHSAI